MKKWYPYRFKTLNEFEREFGYGWRSYVHWNRQGYMDYLFGAYYPFIPHDIDNPKLMVLPNIKNTNEDCLDIINWVVLSNMLLPSKIIEPNYKPKEKIERTI